ncbi:MAG TPA: CRISPR-associated endonuclease Cas2 [Candidatus Paceibacterota bacterium]|nr:CRISPR-associated endonuclease Cas2 [Candidatus Paceibacterota bacterium]
MKYRGYIKGGKGTYRLTTKGRHILNEENVWSLTIPTPPSWDKKWRIVLFDIPKDKRKRRDAFRLRIKELGLVLYQNSVWVYPYPLEETVRAIATFYHLSGCVSFITAEHISGEKKLRSYFNLTY